MWQLKIIMFGKHILLRFVFTITAAIFSFILTCTLRTYFEFFTGFKSCDTVHIFDIVAHINRHILMFSLKH